MANSNTLTEVIPKLLAQGLLALRENAIMPRLVNRAYEVTAGSQGDTIDVPIPSAITASAVTHDVTLPDDTGSVPTKVSVALSQWYEAAFMMSDKDMLEAMSGHIPMEASEAIKALANNVDNAILANYTAFWAYGGTAGTAPFASDASAWLTVRAALGSSTNLTPKRPRSVVLDVDAEANAVGLRAFQDASWRAETDGIREGEIGRKLGADWYVDQNIPTHTAGTASGTLAAALGVLGAKTIATDTGTGTLVVGDIISFADHSQTYVITAANADVSTGSIAFEPGLQTAVPDTTAITLRASHVVNLAFHRDAIAFVNRPFAGADPVGIGYYRSAVDPESQLALRLEVSRGYKRTRFAYDILYGDQVIRKEFGGRIAG